ncbi:MAG: HNH endonuclease, partial [Halobacteriales archaeon]
MTGTPKGRGGSHRLSNLVTLCDDCHAAVHNRYETAP